VKLLIVTTGGTIDKVYYDAKSAYEIGASQVPEILAESHANFDFEVLTLFRKDSLDLTDEDRERIRQAVVEHPLDHVVITHGTDTMVETARHLGQVLGKVVVLTGSLSPARFRNSDAVFNVGMAVGAAQSLPPGVYIAMNGRIFTPNHVRKNRERNRFEEIQEER